MGTKEELQRENEALHQRIAAMEHEMQQSQERFKLVLEATNDGFWDWHIPSGEVYFSPRWLGMLGYGPDELPGTVETWEELLHPDDKARALEIVGAHLQQRSAAYELEFRLRTKDGGWRWILARGKTVAHDEQGQPVRMLGTHTDITERKQAEEQLQEREALLRSVLNNSPAAIFVKDTDGRVILANHQLEHLLQREPGSMMGTTAYDLVPPEIAADVWESEKQTLITGTPMEREEQIPRGDEVRTLLSVKFPIYDNDGSPRAVGGILTDITERKQAEEALLMNKTALEQSGDSVEWIAPDGKMVYVNQATCDLTGYTRDELLSMAVFDLAPDFPREAWPDVWQQLKQEGTFKMESMRRRKDGRLFPVEVAANFIERQGQDMAISFVRDISERKQAEEERTALQEQVIEAQRASLRELSAPLLPISDHVVTLPLIGNIDTQRAQQVIETLLEGVAYYRADIAIVDITGVQVVDTQVANALIQAAQAVQLLGARVVLTGIGPVMAQTLVSLGVDLSGIVTRGSLQQGIAYALTKETQP